MQRGAAPVRAHLGRSWADLRALFAIYVARDPESAWIRARQLNAVVRLTPYMMGANVVNAAVVGLAVAPSTPWLYAAWAVALGVLVTLAIRAYLTSQRAPPVAASRRALGRSTLHATALGIIWGAVPLLWFPSADQPVRIIIATLTAGMMSAGAFALSPLPAASLAYVATLAVASLTALPADGDPLYELLVPLISVYAAVCVLGAFSAGRTSLALLRSQREAERQRHMVTVLLHDFQEHAAEALWETTADGRVTHASTRLCELLQASQTSMLGQSLAVLLETRREGNGPQLTGVLERRLPFRNLLLPASQAPAAERYYYLSGKPIRDTAGGVLAWRGVLVDATAETIAERQLRQLAHFDSVTGLANRVTLREALRDQLARPGAAALVTVDLDRFKAINDTFGHSTGDAVLAAVGERLCQQVRPGDLVARLGGDEFAVLMRNIHEPAEALATARRIVDAFVVPTEAAGRQLVVGASAGIALVPDHGQAVDEVLGNADLALYDAKAAGRGRAAMYARHLGLSHRRRAAVEQALKHVLDHSQLSLVWQPQFDVRQSRIVGAEALLRWDHPTLGVLRPDEFIAVAEQTGTMGQVGEWVLREACRSAAASAWPLDVAVNVSTVQLRDPGFVSVVEQALAKAGLAPQRLEVELTESIFLDDADAVLGRLRELQSLGVRVALDDFGTGYSSLGYLRRFPFDSLKIDRAFVRELSIRPDASAIVGTIIQLGNALNMRTVAEGVETEGQRQALMQLGCYLIQGYLVSRPVRLGELAAMRMPA